VKIYVVDDDASFRHSLTRLLTVIGYIAEDFASIADLPALKISRKDCLLVSSRSGRGQNALTMLARRAIMAPVILMSGAEPEAVLNEHGGRICLIKPFSQTELIGALEAATGQRRPPLA